MVLAALKKKGVDAHAFDPKRTWIGALIQERFDRAFVICMAATGRRHGPGALELLGIPTRARACSRVRSHGQVAHQARWQRAGFRRRAPSFCAQQRYQAVATRLAA